MILYVIRHGETEWNRVRRLQGRRGADLNEDGILLAKLTAEGLRDVDFDICYTSPLLRARHTAEIILEGKDVPVIEEERITELCFGIWEGRSCDMDHLEIDRDNYIRLQKDPFRYEAPEGGETVKEVISRCRSFYEDLVSDPSLSDKTVLISSHGIASRAFLNQFYEDRNDFWQGGVPMNCSVNIVEIKDGKSSFLARDKVYYPEQYYRSYYKLPEGTRYEDQ